MLGFVKRIKHINKMTADSLLPYWRSQ